MTRQQSHSKSRRNRVTGNAAGVLASFFWIALLAPDGVAEATSDFLVDFSGTYRLRVEDFSEPFIGLATTDEFTSVAHRALAGVRLDFKNRYRLFTQIGAFLEDGRKPAARPTDEGDPDVQQLHVDLLFGSADSQSTIRMGRQEMSFGAGRLVSRRDSPNIRRSFDALKVSVPLQNFDLQAFVGRPVRLLDGSFDDRSESTSAFWGVYGALARPNSKSGTDFYYFGLDRDTAAFDHGVGAETRHTIGARIFRKHNAWDWDAEAAVQFGEFGDDDIRAWFVGAEAGHTWKDNRWSPRLALRAHVFSGDDDPSDSDLETFNPLFPKTTFFTQAGLFAPSNAIDIHPLVSFSPAQNFRVTTSIDFFWRFSKNDALYRPPLRPRIPGNANDKRYLGTIFEVLAKWSPTKNIDVTLAFDVGDAEGFIAAAGGEDPRLLLASIQLSF